MKEDLLQLHAAAGTHKHEHSIRENGANKVVGQLNNTGQITAIHGDSTITPYNSNNVIFTNLSILSPFRQECVKMCHFDTI